MKTIDNIDKPVLKEIRETIEPVIIKLVQDQFGLAAKLGSATYTDKSVTFKLEIKAEGMSDLDKQYMNMYGWPAWGEKFTFKGQQYEVCGYSPKKHSKPINIRLVNDPTKEYLMDAESVKKLIKAEKG